MHKKTRFCFFILCCAALTKNLPAQHLQLYPNPESATTSNEGDRAVVTKVLDENINVEDSRGLLMDFKVLHSVFSKDSTRGKIENIVLKI